MKIFVIGDIHGGNRALIQVLERANFDYDKDKLICLGDVADGWSEVPEAIETLLKVKNLIYVRGNHDQWLKDFLKYGKQPDIWVLQGGQASKYAYINRTPELMKSHREFLSNSEFYYIDDNNNCYVHGGIKPGVHPKDTDKRYLSWDRDLWDMRGSKEHEVLKVQFHEIYVGHTSIYRHSRKPLQYGNVWFMDTGGGWEGVLSMMNVDTKEIFQSDLVSDLYPEERGRN
ncbi:MAG: metallophosphoesterase [Bacilli bacterium]|jgi:serine/threonine protein phosphatase 1